MNLNTTNGIEYILTEGLNNFLNVPSSSSRVKDVCVDVVLGNDIISIYVEIPSVKKEDISMEFYNNTLTLTVEKRKPAGYIVQSPERKFGKFTRTINLPIAITRREGIVTKYEDGLLMIEINRRLEEERKFSVHL